jgi:4-aminobutyrate aminotransferase/(S)-3-amino-2-methylpropionate transaminase
LITNRELIDRRGQSVSSGVSTSSPIFIQKAENSEIWDVEGRRFIDFAAGIAVLNVGHRHPKVVEAVRAQLDAYTHVAFQVSGYEPYVALCERLNAIAPFQGPAKSILFTTGAEAVENAVKIARAATGRSAVIAFTGAFHGRTALSMALTGKVAPYKRSFGPSASEIYHIPFPTPGGAAAADTMKALGYLFAADVPPERVAAIIIEPIQGEGGFNPAPPELMRDLRKLADQHGIVLIADEIQSGFARTGKMFGVEHSGVEPDLVTVAKALGGGLPLSGVIGRKALLDAVEPGGLGGTYAGPPLSCAAALAVLDVIDAEDLLGRADAIGERIRSRVSKLSQANNVPPIRGVRGPGAMVGFDIVDGRTGEPDGATARRVVEQALAKGLLLLTAGTHGETIRTLAPLTISDEVLDEGLDILERALVAAA